MNSSDPRAPRAEKNCRMNLVFYLSAAVAVASTTMVILQAHAVHALFVPDRVAAGRGDGAVHARRPAGGRAGR